MRSTTDEIKRVAMAELSDEEFKQAVKEEKEKIKARRSRSLLHKLVPFKIIRR